jgi:ketosteroid isomerase-like protein
MSQENVERVKAFTSLFEAGDRNVWRDYFDPDVVWDTSASSMPSAGVYHGHEGIERFFREWLGAWSDYRIEPREYIDAGGSVVIVFRQSGIGRGSGVRTERDFFGVYDLSDSKVVRYRQYESRKEALEAVGLSEQDAPDDS